MRLEHGIGKWLDLSYPKKLHHEIIKGMIEREKQQDAPGNPILDKSKVIQE